MNPSPDTLAQRLEELKQTSVAEPPEELRRYLAWLRKIMLRYPPPTESADYLLRLEGDRPPDWIEIAPGALIVGTVADATIRLSSEGVSGHHCRLTHDGDDWIAEDLDSTNGTRVGGRPVRRHILARGDALQVGRALLIYIPGTPDC